MQLSFAPLQEAFGTLGPKGLLHPLLTSFGNFQFSSPLRAVFGRNTRRDHRENNNLDAGNIALANWVVREWGRTDLTGF